MNSTTFHTLTEFVKYLGRTGKCRVDETEKGWFISLIQASARDSEIPNFLFIFEKNSTASLVVEQKQIWKKKGSMVLNCY